LLIYLSNYLFTYLLAYLQLSKFIQFLRRLSISLCTYLCLCPFVDP
jgi:hypothetical protein